MTRSLARADILRRRLAIQRLSTPGLASAAEVVRLLTCVQSQEWLHAFWSLGMRMERVSISQVKDEFDTGQFLRTHILRPTWHFVAAEDIRWILDLTSPRVQQRNAPRFRQLGLSQHDLDHSSELIVGALSGGNHLTRPEIGALLTDNGVPSVGQLLVYMLINAELEGRICSGPMRGAQHTYAVLDERVAPTSPRPHDEALAELTLRFFEGHGPASLKDLSRWSSITAADARAGVELVADQLERFEVDGLTLFVGVADLDNSAARDPGPDANPTLLLPLYDEVTLSYPLVNFPVAEGHPHPPGKDLFIGSVIVDEVNVGTWRRTVKSNTVLVETTLAPSLSRKQRAAVDEAVERLAGFLDKDLRLP